MPKPRINIHVSEDVAKRLNKASWRSGIPKSSIVDTALAAFLSSDVDTGRDTAVIKRLEHLERALLRVEEDCTIVSETLALLVLYYLTATTPLTSSERKAAEKIGQQRFERFVEQVIDQLRAGKALSTRISHEFASSEEGVCRDKRSIKEKAS